MIGLWLTGVLIMLFRAIYIIAGGARLQVQSKSLEDEHIIEIIEKLRKSLSITRKIHVAVSEYIAVPGVIGFFKPVLLLPVSMISGVPSEALQAILAHELAHIRRYDYLVNFCQMVIEAILFFNPAVWWISRQIRIEREVCCDNAGIAAVGQRIRYAEVLIHWAQKMKDSDIEFASSAIGLGKQNDTGGMLERIKRIVSTDHRPRLKVSWHIATITLLLSIATLVGLWQGTNATVAFAGKLLTPQERFNKIKEIAQTHNPEPQTYTKEDRLKLSGTVRTADGSPLPSDTRFVVTGFTSRSSSSIHTGFPREGNFSTSIDYFEDIIFNVSASGYAPLISKAYHFEPGQTVSDIELVLENGFTGKIKFIDKEGNPIDGALVSGNYVLTKKNGWSGLSTINESKSGEDGIAVFEHSIEYPTKMTSRANGYQEELDKDVEFKPNEVFEWKLTDAKPATGIVISRETSEPIANAELMLCAKDKPGHSHTFGGFSRIVLARTDEKGQFTLGSLNEEWKYTLIVNAEGYNRTPINDIRMGDKDLRIELGPELHVKGKFIGDINDLEKLGGKPIVRWESRFHEGFENVYDNGEKEIEFIDGHAYFTLNNILGNYIVIQTGNQTRQIEITDGSIDDYVFDLRPEPEVVNENMRQVVIEFEVPEGYPKPEGYLNIGSTSEEDYAKNRTFYSHILEIKDGKIITEVPAPGRMNYGISWDSDHRITGYWIKNESNITITPDKEPYLIKIPAYPGGAIYGKVLEEDGRLAKDFNLSLILLEKPSVMGGSFFSSRIFGYKENEVGKFNASPLPLDGEYAIVAYRNSTWIASEPIKLDQKNPFHELELKFTNGITFGGQVTDPNGKPMPNVDVTLAANIRYEGYDKAQSWGTNSTKTKTNEEGNYTFTNVNSKIPGKYTITIDPVSNYQKVRMEIQVSSKPLNIKLHKGYVLTGTLIDDETGWPIPGDYVYAEAVEKNGKYGDSGSVGFATDENGKFTFTDLDNRLYHIYSGSGQIVNDNPDPMIYRQFNINPTQQKEATLRIKLYDWSKLKPRKPQ